MKSTGQGFFGPGSNPSAQPKPTQGTIGRALLPAGAVQSFETAARKVPISDNLGKSGTASQIDFTVWSEQRIQSYEESRARHSFSILALLRVTCIELEVPLLNRTDTLSLNHGVGWISGTTQPGKFCDIGLAGHKDGFFRRLKDLRVGGRAELVNYDRTDHL